MLRLRVRAVAEAKGYTILRLHREAKISYEAVLKYWHGDIRRIDIKTLDALARALQVSSLDLLEDVDDK